GCHAGFFSLFVVRQRKLQNKNDDFSALLVDGDSRVATSIRGITEANSFGNKMQFLHSAISTKPGELLFDECQIMSSSVVQDGAKTESVRRVPVARPENLTALLKPPYDLVKVDIEGAEHDFLTSYEPILQNTRHLLLEWHSWHFGGGGLPTIRKA